MKNPKIQHLRTPLLWIEDWPVRLFFVKKYIEDAQIKTNEEKLEMIWNIVNRFLLAREAKEQNMPIQPEIVEKKYQELLENKDIKKLIQEDSNIQEDIRFFLTIEALSEVFTAQIEEVIRKDMLRNQEMIRDYYEKNTDLVLKNCIEIIEIRQDKKKNPFQSDLSYQIEDFASDKTNRLGIFDEKEIKQFYPDHADKLLALKVGQIFEWGEDNEDRIYYFISGKYEQYKKKFEEIKEEWEQFIFDQLLKNTLDEIYQKLMDKFSIEYNESCFEQILGENYGGS